ncbi:MAG: helicase UvrD [Candidatus Parcubacteria bacterium]|nr:MAG: helicase UvrD [Candidatus Parcubacteria bacterium]
MKIIADLHLHSKYSRGCSKNLDLENLNYWAKLKGLNLIATGDFTHPLWLKELNQKLEEEYYGIYKLKNNTTDVYFILGGELSSIYKKLDKVRRIHYLIFFPDFESIIKFIKKISAFTNLKSDGRPILGLDANDILKLSLDINEKVIFIPAHIWTPWFSLYGSMSGFDSIYEAFENNVQYLSAVETGLSSDPQMNWRIEELDNITIVSFSDAHSPYPHRIGREATIFEIENLNYEFLNKALRDPDEKNKVLMTIEFFPEEGKYHYDGHRLCRVSFSPNESRLNNYICPICQKKITIGVMSRIKQLSRRPVDYIDNNRPGFKKVIPLTEILAEIYNSQPTSKKILDIYLAIINEFGSEIDILLGNFDKEKMNIKYKDVYNALEKISRGNINIEPGYDGEYGKINIIDNKKDFNISSKKLF